LTAYLFAAALPGDGDGGKSRPRYQKSTWEFKPPGPGINADELRAELHERLMDLLLVSTQSHSSFTHEQIQLLLDNDRNSRSLRQELKDNIPKDFYAMLNALEQMGEKFPQELEYHYCIKCYSLFRKEKQHLDHCACGQCRWELDQQGNPTHIPNGRFIYR
jgi:hypothetical protein